MRTYMHAHSKDKHPHKLNTHSPTQTLCSRARQDRGRVQHTVCNCSPGASRPKAGSSADGSLVAPCHPPLAGPEKPPGSLANDVVQGKWSGRERGRAGGEDVGGGGHHEGGIMGDAGHHEGGSQGAWRPCWCALGQAPSFYAVNGNGFPCIAEAFARRGMRGAAHWGLGGVHPLLPAPPPYSCSCSCSCSYSCSCSCSSRLPTAALQRQERYIICRAVGAAPVGGGFQVVSRRRAARQRRGRYFFFLLQT